MSDFVSLTTIGTAHTVFVNMDKVVTMTSDAEGTLLTFGSGAASLHVKETPHEIREELESYSSDE